MIRWKEDASGGRTLQEWDELSGTWQPVPTVDVSEGEDEHVWICLCRPDPDTKPGFGLWRGFPTEAEASAFAADPKNTCIGYERSSLSAQ